LVLLGRIPLAPRRRPVVTFEKTAEGDGYSAHLSWFPGGRIDRLDWSWSWWHHAGAPGAQAYADRFLLRRPPGELTTYGYFAQPTTPLPGLDGWGTVCLRLEGVQVDPYTGDLVPVVTDPSCTRFGWDIGVVGVDGERLLLRDWSGGTETGLI